MAGSTTNERTSPQNRFQQLSTHQQAAIATSGSIATGGVFTAIGLWADLTMDDVVVVVAAAAVLGLIVGMYGVFRAIFTSAKKEDGDPIVALTHPLFLGLFLALALGVSLFAGVYVHFQA